MAYSIDLHDLSGNVVATGVSVGSVVARWELDGPGSMEVDLADAHMTEIPTSGLAAWYRADAITGVPDGGAVGTWPDSSGAGRHATQSDPTVQPTYLARGIGGRPTVRFEGVGIRLQATLPGLSAVTVLVVGRYTGAAFAQNSAFVGQTASPDVALQTDPNDQAAPHALRARHRNASGAQDGLVTSADAYGTLEPWVATITWDGAQLALYVGGQLIGTAATADPTVLAATWRLGFASGLQAAVDLAEVAVWSGVLSAPDRAAAERAAAWRWGLTSPEPVWLPGKRRIYLLDGATKIWGGHLLGLQTVTARGEPPQHVARARGFRGALEGRIVLGDFSRSSTVATTIAWDLIQHAQAQTNGNLGITLGTITGTAPARTRHYCDGDNIADAIDELASKDSGGFDWEVDADLKLNAWVGGRGTDYTATKTVGPQDVQEWRVEWEGSELATYATALGPADEPCGPPLVTRAGSLASSYLRRDAVVDVDSNVSTDLQQSADNELTVAARGRLRLRVVVLEQTDTLGLRSLSLGDRITARLGAAYGGNVAVRLIAKAVTIEPPELPWWELEFEVVS